MSDAAKNEDDLFDDYDIEDDDDKAQMSVPDESWRKNRTHDKKTIVLRELAFVLSPLLMFTSFGEIVSRAILAVVAIILGWLLTLSVTTYTLEEVDFGYKIILISWFFVSGLLFKFFFKLTP